MRWEDSSTILGSLRFLWKWKSKTKDGDKKHETTSDFKKERLKRRGNREKNEVAHLPKDQARTRSCCHNLRKVLYREGKEVKWWEIFCRPFLRTPQRIRHTSAFSIGQSYPQKMACRKIYFFLVLFLFWNNLGTVLLSSNKWNR